MICDSHCYLAYVWTHAWEKCSVVQWPTSSNERHLSARLYVAKTQVSLAALRGYLIIVWIEADIGWLTRSPESIISLMKPPRSEKTGPWLITPWTNSQNMLLVIHDLQLDLGLILNRASPVSLVLFLFFWHAFIGLCAELCLLLHTTGSTQYSADNGREGERLGKDVNGNDNAWAEYIH